MAQPIRVLITGDASGLTRALGQSESGLARFGAAAGGMAVRAGAAVGAAVGLMAGGALALGVRAASQAEQAQVAFTTMLGSATAAKTFLAGLQDFANRSPFELPDLTVASQRLLAMGFAARDVVPTLTAIGDAVAGLGGGKEQIDQVTTAIGQMQAKGKVQSDELLQLTEAGIPALKILASSYGVTAGQMQEMVTKGKVLSGDAIPKLIAGIENGTASTKGFGGMMEAQSKTMAGLYSTLKDTVTSQLTTAVAPLEPLIKDGLGGAIAFAAEQGPRLADALKGVVEAGGRFRDWLIKAVGAVRDFFTHLDTAKGPVGAVRDAVLRFAEGFERLFKTLGPVVRDLFPKLRDIAEKLAPIVGGVLVGAFVALSVLFNAMTKVVKFVVDHWVAFRTVLGIVIGVITVGLVPAIVLNIGLMAQLGAAAVAAGLRTVGAWLAAQAAAVAAAAAQVAAGARMIAGWVAQAAVAVASAATVVASWVLMGVQAMIQAVRMAAAWLIALGPVGWVIGVIGLLVAAFIFAWKKSETFRDIVKGTWAAIKTAAAATWDWITGKVKAAANLLVAIFRNFSLPGIIMSHWGAIKSGATKAWNAVIDFIRGVPGKITGVFSGAGKWLSDIGRRIMDGLRDGIVAGLRAVKDTLQSVGNSIKQWKGPPAADAVLLRPAGRAIMGGLVTGIDTGLPALRSKLGDVTAAINLAPGAGWTPNRAPLAAGGAALLHIENFHAGGQSTQAIAADLAWALRR